MLCNLPSWIQCTVTPKNEITFGDVHLSIQKCNFPRYACQNSLSDAASTIWKYYLQHGCGVSLTHLKHLQNIPRNCGARGNGNSAIQGSQQINELWVIDYCKRTRAPRYPDYKLQLKFSGVVCWSMGKCGNSLQGRAISWFAVVSVSNEVTCTLVVSGSCHFYQRISVDYISQNCITRHR